MQRFRLTFSNVRNDFKAAQRICNKLLEDRFHSDFIILLKLYQENMKLFNNAVGDAYTNEAETYNSYH